MSEACAPLALMLAGTAAIGLAIVTEELVRLAAATGLEKLTMGFTFSATPDAAAAGVVATTPNAISCTVNCAEAPVPTAGVAVTVTVAFALSEPAAGGV